MSDKTEINIHIVTTNEAFMNGNKGWETARILRQAADRYAQRLAVGYLKDARGNTVGKIQTCRRNCLCPMHRGRDQEMAIKEAKNKRMREAMGAMRNAMSQMERAMQD